MKLSEEFIFILSVVVIIATAITIMTVSAMSKNKSCPVAEVYMLENVQEDDLFIPASSIGRVDLKR